MSDSQGGRCIQCDTALAETGAPIWETYCPNKACDYERKQFLAGIRTASDRHELEEYLRLKAKFAPNPSSSNPQTTQGSTTNG